MGRPSMSGRPLQIRFPETMLSEMDKHVGSGKRAHFIRKAVQDRLDTLSGRRRKPSRRVEVPVVKEPVAEVVEAGAHPDDAVVLSAVRASPGIGQKEVARNLGWMEMRVSKAVGRLSAAGSIWFPQSGCMEAFGE